MLRVLVFVFCFWPLAVFSQTVPADGTGLQVRLIPAGLRALTADSHGRQAIWSFLGRRGDVWVAELRGETGELIRTEHYNAEGYLVAQIWADGGQVRYTPYRCTDQLGKCRHVRTGPDGGKDAVSSDVRRTGSTYTAYLNGRAHLSFKLGSYNIRTMVRQGNDWIKVKRIGN